MRYAGKKVDAPKVEVIVIPKGGEEYVFRLQPVLDYDEFDKLCPRPQPPTVRNKQNKVYKDENDADYKAALDTYTDRTINWMVLKSLQATEELEWETVDMADPETWSNWQTELKEAGFSQAEMVSLVSKVTDACGLNQSKIDEATERFLHTHQQE